MSGLDHLKGKIENAFISGEPGTTGREPFEDSTASGPAQRFASGQGLTGSGESGNIGLGGHSGHSHSHSHGTGTSTGAPSAGYGDILSGTGLGQSGTTGIGSGVGSHHSHHDNKDVGLGGGHLTGAAGGPATAVGSGVGHRDHGDRVGAMGQDSQDFEGRNHGGPLTSGAAGTDRFDSDRTHGSSTGTGAVGSDRQYADGVQHDTSQKAPGKSSGGLAGVFTTSDKDFTGRDRLGKGAYADTDGKFEMNKTGPAGNTALTGREGNVENNPVAQAKSRDTAGVGHGDASDINHPSHPEHPEHKSFLQKVKDAIL